MSGVAGRIFGNAGLVPARGRAHRKGCGLQARACPDPFASAGEASTIRPVMSLESRQGEDLNRSLDGAVMASACPEGRG